MMDLGLEGKTAIVTGGGSNIGKAIVEGLSEEGANVVIADVDRAQADRVVEGLRAAGRDGALFVETDVADRTQVENLVNRTLEAFGQIDILVNNAGWTINGLFLEKPVEEWEREVDINLWGPINCVRAAAPSMVARSYGKIITIGSDAGRVGEYQEAVYSACKGGIIALSKSLAREFGRYGITVNVVSPGLTLPDHPDDAGAESLWHAESPQRRIFQDEDLLARIARKYPLRRIGVPGDIVPMVLLLSSDKASYVTGQVISVSGGYAM
jgi:2-hydroxycyclohexanecarboxyl-CoA dehydrogenase